MKVIILAGGFATRLWPLTEKRAKPLLPVAGKPIISHLVDAIPNDHEIIVSTNQVFADDFNSWKAGYPDKKIEIFVEDSGSDDFKKGALGAVAFTIEQKNIQEDLVVLAGDNLFGFSFDDFFDAYKNEALIAVYDIKDLGEAKKYGVVVAEGDRVTGFQEKPAEPKSTLVSTGCYIFPANTLSEIIHYAKDQHDDLGGIFEHLLKQGKPIDYYSFEDHWYDIGSFSGYLNAHKALQKDIVQDHAAEEGGVNEFIGSVWIDTGAKIHDSTLEDTLILKDTTVKNCCIRNCIIDEACVLENVDLHGKIIRKGTVIQA